MDVATPYIPWNAPHPIANVRILLLYLVYKHVLMDLHPMDILSTREWAILMWVSLAVFCVILSPKRKDLKEPLKSLVRALFARHLVSAIVLMSIYVGLVIYAFLQLGLWDSSQIKNTLIWYFSVGAFYLFRLEDIKKDPHYVKNAILDNLKLLGIIEYLIGVYTFHIFWELALVPIVVTLTAMIAIAENEPQYHSAHRFLNGILAFVGLSILTATFYIMAGDFGKVTSEDGVRDFVGPPLLTTAYAPFIAFLVVYSTYQTVFARLSFSIKDKPVQVYAKLSALLVFNFRIGLLNRWATNVARRNVSSIADVNQSIRQIFSMLKRERNPPSVDSSEGWSPYEAKDYLLSEGIKTRHYHPVEPEEGHEWFCASDFVEFGEGLWRNNIAYYLNGNERAVKSLKLQLNVNSPEQASEAHAKLLLVAGVLIRQALGLEIKDVLEQAISPGIETSIKGPDFQIELLKNVWFNHASGGYNLDLVVFRI